MLRCSGGSVRAAEDTTLSPTAISPAVGSTKPAIRRNVVVLPQPEGPSRQTSNPCSTRSDTSSTTGDLSYRLVRFRSSTDATHCLLAPSPAGSSAGSAGVSPALCQAGGTPALPGNASPAGEHGRALLHECPAAFRIVIALEAFLDHGGAFGEVALRLVLDDLTDDKFRGSDRHRGVFADRVSVLLHIGFEFGRLYDAVDESHGARLFGIELARRVEDFLGEGGAHHVDELFQPMERLAEAELRSRHRETRIIRADAQVATQREPDAAADAKAADHRNGRLRIIVDRRIGAFHGLVVARDRFLIGPFVLESRNVGSRHERLVAGAGQHDDADIVVLAEIIENARGCLPHFQRNGVAAYRVVEDHVADMPLLAGQHLVRLDHRVHGFVLEYRVRGLRDAAK